MIKLTLNPDSDPRIQTFDAKEVIIGNHTSTSAHLKIGDPHLRDIHIKIIEDEGRCLVINAANDPFCSLNGLPFGKKTLKNGDLIQIAHHAIQCEFVKFDETAQIPGDPEVSKTEEPEMAPPISNLGVKESKESKFRESESGNYSPFDIEALLQEVELLNSGQKAPEPVPQTSPQPSPQIQGKQKECDKSITEKSVLVEESSPEPAPEDSQEKNTPALMEFGDSPPTIPIEAAKNSAVKAFGSGETRSKVWNEDNEKREKKQLEGFAKNWKMFAGIFAALLILSTIVCSGVYFRASGKNSQEEKKIAAGVADIAMAMTHAQLNHITPNKQNWADPEFISYNLTCVLSPNLHSQAQIDDQGQFTRYPYILRVYTSGDMNRFLVIAQPAPHLLQWLVHKKTIVLDSTSMEMRKIADLKKLNRLLANPNPFDGQNGTEITKVVKEGSLMSLASLSGNKNHWGFIPPKALAFIRPGAENYIYNAPRYYPFGESILRKAVALTQSNVTSSEVSALQEEMTELSAFPDLVLYTSQGLQSAIEAQKALAIFSPASKFLVGYVKFNNKGYVASSHIFMNDDTKEIALMEPGLISRESLLKPSGSSGEMGDEEVSSFGSYEEEREPQDSGFLQPLVDTNHPLFLRLNAIASSRSRALSPLGEKISELVLRQNREMIPDFNFQVSGLIKEYLETDEIHRVRMVQELAQLYQEYSEIPLEEFMMFIEASKLTSFITEALKSQKNQIEDFTAAESDTSQRISAVQEAKTLEELDNIVQEAASRLTLEKFPDPEKLIFLQERLHNGVLDKLSQLLLSPESPYARSKIDEQDRTTLVRILKTAWVNDPDEFDFFIREWEILKSVMAN